jgi:hypothetical protein
MCTTTIEKIRLKSFEIMCNIIHMEKWRKKLSEEGYFFKIYKTMGLDKIENKTLEKLSWMTTLICFHPDMIE